MNNTCEYNFSVPTTFDVEAKQRELGINKVVKVILETNRTYTVIICERKQFSPKRRYDNGTYVTKTDLDKEITDEWRRKKDGDTKIYTRESSYSFSEESAETKQRTTDTDGWDGNTYDKDKTDWGKSDSDGQYEKDTTKTKAVSGYGKPSKGKYSADLGGFKTFGTEGQGNSQIGVKDTNDTKCGDRVMLVTIEALHDTYEMQAPPPPPRSVHPVVRASTSSITLEFGNYEFLSTMGHGTGPSELFGVNLRISIAGLLISALSYISA